MSIIVCKSQKLKDIIITLKKGKTPVEQPYFGQDAELYLTPEYLRGKASAESVRPGANAIRVVDGDTIVLWDGSNAGEFFRARNGILASTMSLINPNDDFDKNYFFYAVKNREFYLKAQTSGSGIPHVDKEILEGLEIFQFSKPEQAKIAEILSFVDRAIEQTEALIEKQQRIKTGLMQDLLTHGIDKNGNLRSEETHEFKESLIGRIPVEWEVETLGQVIGPIISGWSPNCDNVPISEGEWGVLKTTAVVWEGYDPNENKRLPSDLDGVQSIEVQLDDILITRKGPVERVGVVVHVNKAQPKLMIPDTVFRTRLLEDSGIIPAFLPCALGCVAVQSDWSKKKIGLADAQVNLNHSILRNTLFPKPKPEEQHLIIKFAANISEHLFAELSTLHKLKSLKTGLMQDLLTGKKRVTVLLKEKEVKA